MGLFVFSCTEVVTVVRVFGFDFDDIFLKYKHLENFNSTKT